MSHTFRYIVPAPIPGDALALSAKDSHHLRRVVRRGIGDRVELIDGEGNLWPATVVHIDEIVTVRVAEMPLAAPAGLAVRIAVGLAEFGRLDTLVEKATELGIPQITFFASQRARRVPDAAAFASRRERMLRVCEAAARQAGHGRTPIIDGLVTFAQVLAQTNVGGVLVDPRAEVGLAEVIRRAGRADVQIIVGPEAGFAPGEIADAEAAGVALARLGEATLRTETAAIVAATVAATALGHFA